MSSEFSNIDFGFRYGSTSAVNAAVLENGTFNIATDTGELYIDIDNKRITMNKDINIYNTEAEIRALLNPDEGKLYYSKDTYRLFAYDATHLKWINAGGSPTEILEKVEALKRVVNAMHSFEVLVLEDGESLPETGESHIIYFVPQPVSDDDTRYDEFVWIASEEYYEKIGVSSPELSNYYKKTEVDSIVTGVNNTITNLTTTVNNNKTSIEQTVTNLTTTVGNNKTAIEQTVTDLTTTVGNNKTAIEQTVSNLTTTVNNNYSTLSGSVTSLNTAVGNLETGKAPTSHASDTTTYGAGSSAAYGHVKVSDVYNSSVGAAADGVAASQKALYDAYIALSVAINDAVIAGLSDVDCGDEDD